MRSRFPVLLAAALAAAATSAVPVRAEAVDPELPKPIEPPATLPRAQSGDKSQNLDRLFEALKVAPDEDSAKYVENRIWAIWLATPSDTASLLMARAKEAIDGKDTDIALKLLDAVIKLRPDYIEAWNRRATVYYLMGQYQQSLADIDRTLELEPRHIGALSGLGLVNIKLEREEAAADAFERVLAIAPKNGSARNNLDFVQDILKRKQI